MWKEFTLSYVFWRKPTILTENAQGETLYDLRNDVLKIVEVNFESIL